MDQTFRYVKRSERGVPVLLALMLIIALLPFGLAGCATHATVSAQPGGPLIDDPVVVQATNQIEKAKEVYKATLKELLALRQQGDFTNDDLWHQAQQAEDAVNIGLKEAMAALEAYIAHQDSTTTGGLDDALATMQHLLTRFQFYTK